MKRAFACFDIVQLKWNEQQLMRSLQAHCHADVLYSNKSQNENRFSRREHGKAQKLKWYFSHQLSFDDNNPIFIRTRTTAMMMMTTTMVMPRWWGYVWADRNSNSEAHSHLDDSVPSHVLPHYRLQPFEDWNLFGPVLCMAIMPNRADGDAGCTQCHNRQRGNIWTAFRLMSWWHNETERSSVYSGRTTTTTTTNSMKWWDKMISWERNEAFQLELFHYFSIFFN